MHTLIDTFHRDNRNSKEYDRQLGDFWFSISTSGNYEIVNDRERQFKGMDVIIDPGLDTEFSIDTKHDMDHHDTGNLFIEEFSNTRPGRERAGPFLLDETEMDWIYYFLWYRAKIYDLFVGDAERLKNWFRENRFRFELVPVKDGRTINKANGRAIPQRILLEEGIFEHSTYLVRRVCPHLFRY